MLVISLLFILGCAAKVETAVVKPGAPPELLVEEFPFPIVDDLDKESLKLAISRSLGYYSKLPEETLLSFGDRRVSVGLLKESLSAFQEILGHEDPPEIREKKIRETFDVYRADPSAGSILLTGYYEPVLKGSPVQSERYRYPIYGVPDDLTPRNAPRGNATGGWNVGKAVPYYSRAEIEQGGLLRDKNLEIAWLDDPVDVFFLHTQGSGRVLFPDGTSIRVGYARSNGRPFRSVARYLISIGKITERETSYEAVKRYLKAQPEKDLFPILYHNECYVFFEIVPEGPRGALGVPLTEGRSIAVDSDVYPRGAIAFLKARKPSFDSDDGTITWTPFSRMVVSQDAGVAIKGPGRVDLFCGSGGEAERIAGYLKESCELYFFLKKR